MKSSKTTKTYSNPQNIKRKQPTEELISNNIQIGTKTSHVHNLFTKQKEFSNLNSAVEDTTEANPIFENLVDLHYCAVRLVATAVSHVVDMECHLRHPQFSVFSSPQFLLNSKPFSPPRFQDFSALIWMSWNDWKMNRAIGLEFFSTARIQIGVLS